MMAAFFMHKNIGPPPKERRTINRGEGEDSISFM